MLGSICACIRWILCVMWIDRHDAKIKFSNVFVAAVRESI